MRSCRTLYDRPARTQMLAAAREHKFDALVVRGVSLGSRKSAKALTQVGRLIEVGISRDSVQGDIHLTTWKPATPTPPRPNNRGWLLLRVDEHGARRHKGFGVLS